MTTRSPAEEGGKRERARVFAEIHDDLSDGAFFALMEEHGIDAADFLDDTTDAGGGTYGGGNG